MWYIQSAQVGTYVVHGVGCNVAIRHSLSTST